MTLADIISIMEDIASAQPAVNMIVENDVYKLSSCSDAKYGVFAFTQGTHRAVTDSALVEFSFYLFYIDRILEDGSNTIEVQSTGIEVLRNILDILDYDHNVENSGASFVAFRQRFLDECAGVYCSVTFTVPADTLCSQDFTAQKVKRI